jgi:casein kinase II subunit alpha
MEYAQNIEFRTLYDSEDFTQDVMKKYIFEILKGLDFAHSRGIIHRDIKPGNVLFMNDNKVKIVDWGLADFYLPGKKFNTRVASRYFKGPELLLGNNYYDYNQDVWSVGCMLAGMMF